mgnify:CR=1 FL=1
MIKPRIMSTRVYMGYKGFRADSHVIRNLRSVLRFQFSQKCVRGFGIWTGH